MRCARPGCSGAIVDGYCDVCGLPATTAAEPPPETRPAATAVRTQAASTPAATPPRPVVPSAALASRPAAPQPTALGPRPIAPSPVPAPRPATPSPSVPASQGPDGGPCRTPGCPGRFQDGYCTVCGASANAAATAAASTTALLTGQLSMTAIGSARLAANPAGALAARARATAVRPRSGSLGAGLTHVVEEAAADPATAILSDPAIPEDRRNCPSCGAPVGRAGEGGAGRLEGYCPQCRQPFSFTVKLQPGELVAGQYEVRGPLAYGGMGWIYLAQDRNVSNRWVVLKGLLNAGDDSAQASAIAEQRFLAEVQHPLIVEIFNFVTHLGAAYIVMEFVNGRSVKQILKDRMSANGGAYDPLPLDQACAIILGILPAFDYLHHRGLLYCDFKPDNLMHIEDTVKLIDLGGVRRMDDDVSPIFGTVGFQAPEVATQGCSVASDIYTIGRTLLVCCAEVRGYQGAFQHSLPPPDQLGALGRADSLYRLVAKACAPVPADRFGSVEELRGQLLGVLRETVGRARGGAATSTASSDLFEAPTIAADAFDWTQLPRIKTDLSDPAHGWVAALGPLSAADRRRALANPPAVTPAVELARCWTGLLLGDHALVAQQVQALLTADPWDWRAAWLAGLSALLQSRWDEAQGYFNAVFSQVPGELAPQFALAVACEMGGRPEVAEGLYEACAATDQGYLTGASFGLARIRARRQTADGRLADLDGVLAALAMIPPTARGYLEAHRLEAAYLVSCGKDLGDLQRALRASHAASLDPVSQAKADVQIFQRALAFAPPNRAPARDLKLGDTPFTRPALRGKLEETLRTWAKLEQDPARRTQLIDEANRTRKWTLL